MKKSPKYRSATRSRGIHHSGPRDLVGPIAAISYFNGLLAGWTPEEIAQVKRWVETWRRAGPELERIRRQELRQLDQYRAIEMLCGDYDYTVPPRVPKPTSGMVEMQRWFRKAAGRD